MSRLLTVAFGLCFALALFASTQAQIGPKPGGSGGTPGGSDTHVQFNDAGAFAGDAQVVINKTNHILAFNGATSSFGGLKQCSQAISTDNICVRKADDSDWGTLALANFNIHQPGGSTRTGTIDSGAGGLRFIALNNGPLTLDAASSGGNKQIITQGISGTVNQGLSLSNGLNSNIALSASFARITGPTAAFSIGGFTAGFDGAELRLYNTVSQAMTVVNEDASSTAANRISTLTGANVTLRTGTSFASFVYDGTGTRWILQSTN